MPELREGTLLAGRYVLVRRIGSGGMAEVWLAEDRKLESRVALKFLKNPESAGSRELLQIEWRLGSRLMHANIVRVFEIHDDDDAAFYSMQFINGPDAGVMCGASLEEVLGPIGLIADALRYAHAKNLFHRDIKASNVLLDSRGVPYLIDFGVAAILGEAAKGGGTDIAVSPEQRAGVAPAASDDIFSLGVLMIELITGKPPLDSVDNAEPIVDQHGDPLPTALRDLISEMRSEDVAIRPTAALVQQRLFDAGFRAAPAPTRLLGNLDAGIDIENVESIRPFARKAPAAAQQSPQQAEDGVSSKALYVGLAVLLTVVTGVIFFLPSLVDDKPTSQPEAELELQREPVAGQEKQSGDEPDSARDVRGEESIVESADETDVLDDQDPAGFSENIERRGDTAALTKAATDEALGDFLSRLERLQFRAIDRWGSQPYLDMLEVYAQGDRAYVDRDYALAGQFYRKALLLLDPFFDQVDAEFNKALAAAKDAFENSDHINAVIFYDLAAAITPGNSEADTGLARARNLKKVLDLMEQALQFEDDLELDAARIAFEQVLDLDAIWEPATAGLKRLRAAIKQFSFDQRMTEGFDALSAGDYGTARAAFNAAKLLVPNSRQPADGLLQVDQEIRLSSIGRLEREAQSLENNEEWETAIGVYEEILEIDTDLQFAQDGLLRTRQRARLYRTLEEYINDPDSLSAPVTMQNATNLLLSLSRVSPMGPRLEDQKNSLSRLLKRAATPLDVMLLSDSQTQISILRVAKLGMFESRALSLRPGVYVAVGNRPGYRDVRIEFRVAPEIEMKPIVVRCEEQI